MFPPIFLTACLLYAVLDLWLVRGLRNLGKLRKSALLGNLQQSLSRVGSIESIGSESSAGKPMVSVLVAARDEEDNLPQTLHALLAQNWPADRLQIVVVNDRSVDGTAALLRGFAERHPGLIEVVQVDELPPGLSPKKHALMRGLEKARGEWIAVTDADCFMGPGWIAALAREFHDDTGMVIGLTTYAEPVDGFSPSGGTRALEFVSYGVSAAALVGLGFPVIANANNLAYRRTAFDEAGAFARHGSVVSGDDDFTLQEIHATGKWAIRYCADPEAKVATTPPETWAHFWEQRKRWAGKCLHYRPAQVAFLLAVYAFYASIAVLLLLGLFHIGDGSLGLLGLIGLTVKTTGDFFVMREGFKLLGLMPLLRFFPFTAALHIPLVLGATVAGTFGSFTWKGQKLGRKAKTSVVGSR